MLLFSEGLLNECIWNRTLTCVHCISPLWILINYSIFQTITVCSGNVLTLCFLVKWKHQLFSRKRVLLFKRPFVKFWSRPCKKFRKTVNYLRKRKLPYLILSLSPKPTAKQLCSDGKLEYCWCFTTSLLLSRFLMSGINWPTRFHQHSCVLCILDVVAKNAVTLIPTSHCHPLIQQQKP